MNLVQDAALLSECLTMDPGLLQEREGVREIDRDKKKEKNLNFV